MTSRKTADCMAVCEISFQRLLKQCKLLARDGVVEKNQLWRLDRYVQHLEKLYIVIQEESSINPENVIQYGSELHFLKMIIEAEKKDSPEAKLLAIEHVAEPSAPTGDTQGGASCSSAQQPQGGKGPGVTSRQVKRTAIAQHHAQLRRELMAGGSSSSLTAMGGGVDTGIRLRGAADRFDVSENTDLDTVLKHHHQMQQGLADEFLKLTRGLKENARVAGTVVRDDNKALETVTKRAALNQDRLDAESRRLEHHARSSLFSCSVYLILFAVVLTFIGMVLFMRLFRKPRYDSSYYSTQPPLVPSTTVAPPTVEL